MGRPRFLLILCYNKKVLFEFARVVKLVYTYALGAYAVWCAGSSPVSGTMTIYEILFPGSCLEILILVYNRRYEKKIGGIWCISAF